MPRVIKGGLFKGLIMDLDLADQMQLYLGLFEREIHGWLEQFVAGARTAIDIGAGEGEYTLYFLCKTSVSKVFSFEPSSESRHALEANLKNNYRETDPRLHVWSMFVGCAGENHLSLDSLLERISFPCVIKVDVDGGERDILEGASELSRCGPTRWIVETHSEQLERSCMSLLKNAGLQVQVVPNAWWRKIIPELRHGQNRWVVAY